MTQTPSLLFANPDKDQARVYTVNFAGGGAITASRGLIDSLFASSILATGACSGTVETISVKSHSRQRVIGGTSRTVAGYSYSYKGYPTTPKNARSGGEEIQIRVNGEWWTARLSGSHQLFMQWLCSNSSALAQPIYWKSQHGTNYGPVGAAGVNP